MNELSRDQRTLDPAIAARLQELRGRLQDWMERTDDPLLAGPVPPAPGTVYNTVDQTSPNEPTTPRTTHSLTHTRRRRGKAPSGRDID